MNLHIFCTSTLESLYYKSKHYGPRSDCSLGFGSIVFAIKAAKVHKQMREQKTFLLMEGKGITWADPEGGTGGLKNKKNIGFLCNTGLDPLKNYKASKPAYNVGPSSTLQVTSISMAFRWRADDGPFLALIRSSIPSSTKNKNLWQNFLDPRMDNYLVSWSINKIWQNTSKRWCAED